MFESDGDMGLPSTCGVCHFNCLYKSAGQEDRKELMKHFGWWNWDILKRLHNDSIFRDFSGNVSRLESPQLMALNPKLEIKMHSKDYLQGSINELRKMAAVLGRRLVWPYVACNAPFLERDQNSRLGVYT